MQKKMMIIIIVSSITAVVLAGRVFAINFDEKVINASSGRGQYKISKVSEYASIYDCKGNKLNNLCEKYEAIINPNDNSIVKVLPYIMDNDAYNAGLKGNLPFLCEVSEDALNSELIVFKSYERTDKNQLAEHIVGYTLENEGVCGLEYAYNDFFRSNYSVNKAEYSVNAVGSVLDGLYSDVSYAKELADGIIISIDGDIQKICENAIEKSGYPKGAIVVMDIKSGEIRACVSYPQYDITDLESSLNSEDAPFINRAFSAYSVGSIFKLVTSATALELGISPDYSYICSGSIDVNGQLFNCHKWGGHGEINMYDAIVQSCNPYFISLSEYLDSSFYLETAQKLGFGSKSVLGNGMYSSSGYFPTEKELAVKAEKGNFSFGQGKLTATPLQICRMTATIANNGMCPEPKLVLGIKDNGEYEKISYPINKRAISYLTAKKLKEFMVSTVETNNSRSKSYIVQSGGKTSTAQTGRFDSNGNEMVNCWFTGYFSAENPKYAVTILIEDGISGNASAAPIYKKIVESITELEQNKTAVHS